ncbi:MAG: hypothetical protein M3042_10485 [Actinomycetota bacterium]|nr:hypothetical protein [Actinomycetota bacterium]
MDQDPLLASLLAAVTANPADVPLRLHVARILLDHGQPAAALSQRPAPPGALSDAAPASPADGRSPAGDLDWRAYEEKRGSRPY